MENNVIIVTDAETLGKEIESAIKRVFNGESPKEKFEDDKMSISEASKFVNMSKPTFLKRVNENTFKRHGSGRKTFFLKSELIQALTNN